MNAVDIRNVTKTFGELTAVNDLSLTIPEGSVYGFIGPNGSGKSTTMRMIANILYPDRGDVRVFGEPPRTGNSFIGYLPEERGLYRLMTVQTLLEFYAELRGARNIRGEVQSWLRRFELEKWAGSKVQSLSKGMSQKVQFLATVIPEPKLLILDEPFSGLDPVSAEVIREAILDLRRRGTTVILSTHDMNVAAHLCDYIVMIFRGNKVLDGTLSAIQKQYGSDTIRVEVGGGLSSLADLPGIVQVRDLGQAQELRMAPSCDPQLVLRTLLTRTTVTGFSVVQPSLQDIFVRIAGPAAEAMAEAHHAA